MKLTDNPQHVQQTSLTSCVPTCIAMAVGEPLEFIIAFCKGLNLDISRGMSDRMSDYLLNCMGISTQRILNYGLGFPDGHYLVEVASLNQTGCTHCVFVFVEGGEARVFDPNKGRVGISAYDSDFEQLPVLTFTKLDDFQDLQK